jgi:acetylglutamate kinase
MSASLEKCIVVKLGGSVFDCRDTTLADMVALQKEGRMLVVVHGGANLVTQWLKDQGVISQFRQGERITDRKSLEVVTAVLAGLANKETVAALEDLGGRAVGISGVDGGLVQGRVRDRNLGYIGTVVKVDPSVVMSLVQSGFIPIVAPVSLNIEKLVEGEPRLLNVNGDTAAGEIATALHAARLVFLTDVEGIRGADGKRCDSLTPVQAQSLLDSGVAAGGMIPKVKACLTAALAGVTCHIVDGRRPHALLNVVRGQGGGTRVEIEN